MDTHIISIANKKGGVGKTSIGVFMATALACKGKKVLYLDCDSQASAYEYRQFEKGIYGEEEVPPFRILKKEPAFLLDEIEDYENKYDVIFIDIPRFTHGKDDKIVIALLALCQSVLIPVKSGELDCLSTLTFIDMIKTIAAHKASRNKPYKYAAFLNQIGRRRIEIADSRNFIEELDVHMFNTELPDLKEFSKPFTYESLLEKTKATKTRFEPFFNEAIKYFNL